MRPLVYHGPAFFIIWVDLENTLCAIFFGKEHFFSLSSDSAWAHFSLQDEDQCVATATLAVIYVQALSGPGLCEQFCTWRLIWIGGKKNLVTDWMSPESDSVSRLVNYLLIDILSCC